MFSEFLLYPLMKWSKTLKKMSGGGTPLFLRTPFSQTNIIRESSAPPPPPSPDFAVVVGLFVDVDAES